MDRTKTIACLMALLCASCQKPAAVVIGSKNLTEQVLLGEILAQQIERRLHVTVERKLDLGGTLLAHQALVKGDIDLYPEYTGTALTAVLKQHPMDDPAAVLDAVRALYHSQFKLEWLAPLGFNNTFAIVIRGEDARARHLTTLSEAAVGQPWRMGVGYEFVERPDGLDGLIKAYGLHMAQAPVSMDLGLLYTALTDHHVDMIAGSATDGQIAKLDVKVLADDRHYFPPYQCAVVVREAAEAKVPGLRGALEELSGKISDETMRKLNYAVDVEHRSARKVAEEFLNGK